MDFDRIVRSAYSWVSISKVVWFVAFFWIALPFIIILPQIFQSGTVYSQLTKPLAFILYDVLYIALIFGVIMLIQRCLVAKREKVAPLSLGRVIDLIFLVFVEMFYVFVWNMNVRLRKLQILLIISTALFGYLFVSSLDIISLVVFAWSLLAYMALVIRNAITVFFSTSIFCNRAELGIKDAIKESWAITNNRVADTFSSIIVSAFLAFILFSFITIALGAVAAIILRFFFIDSIAVSIGFKVAMAFGLGIALIAYHFMIAEVYSQLDKHKAVSQSIRRILSRRVLSPAAHKHISPRRSFAGKKAVKKKRR